MSILNYFPILYRIKSLWIINNAKGFFYEQFSGKYVADQMTTEESFISLRLFPVLIHIKIFQREDLPMHNIHLRSSIPLPYPKIVIFTSHIMSL